MEKNYECRLCGRASHYLLQGELGPCCYSFEDAQKKLDKAVAGVEHHESLREARPKPKSTRVEGRFVMESGGLYKQSTNRWGQLSTAKIYPSEGQASKALSMAGRPATILDADLEAEKMRKAMLEEATDGLA